MNKIGTLDIIKAYLGNKELTANNAYIGEISLIKGSGPTPVGPPNDEIWYTSSDGNIVTPYSTEALPTIVSNTYNDGKGVIKCASVITSIGRDAFTGRPSLTSVTIPNSVTSIGDYAFYNCYSLSSISYTGTIAQYNAITKGYVWHKNAPATVVHCTDGDTAI